VTSQGEKLHAHSNMAAQQQQQQQQPNRLATSLALFDRIIDSLSEEDVEEFAAAVERRLASKLGIDQDDCDEDHGHHHPHHERNRDLHREEQARQDAVVTEAIKALKEMVPLSAQAPDEEALGRMAPAEDPTGRFTGCTPQNSMHVDAFLFTDEDVDDLCEQKKMSRHYCAECGSRNVQPLNFISHSASRGQLEFVFGPDVLCRGRTQSQRTLEGKTIADIGSRLGAVLYVAWARTQAREIVGIERNPWFCDVQRRVLERLPQFAPRVRIVQDDVRTQAELLSTADVVVLNNVFEFFTDSAAQELELWRFIRSAVRKRGCRVVTIPSLAETAERFGPAVAASLGFATWVREVPLSYPEDSEGAAGDDLRDIHLYVVR